MWVRALTDVERGVEWIRALRTRRPHRARRRAGAGHGCPCARHRRDLGARPKTRVDQLLVHSAQVRSAVLIEGAVHRNRHRPGRHMRARVVTAVCNANTD